MDSPLAGPVVRPITDDEVTAWCVARGLGFYQPDGAADVEVRRPQLILDRTFGGFDGDHIVATLRSFPTRMTVPGGNALDVSAVTAVTTTSTHRRRGFATKMVHDDLAAAKERGETAAVLLAAEWKIYRRFGYGPATEHQLLTLNGSATLRPELAAGLVGHTVEFVDVATARAAATQVYEAHHRQTAGELHRSDWFLDIDFGLIRFPSNPEPKKSFHVVAKDPSGKAIGVLGYEYEDKWNVRQADGVATVQRFFAATPVAQQLLWRHLLELDWVRTIKAGDRPAEDPLPWFLTEARDAQYSERSDFLWLRPLDVPGMLSARTYRGAGSLVIEVVDEGRYTGGRFLLETDSGESACVPTDRTADLTMPVDVLGSIYLGGYGANALATAGFLDEHTAGAAELADRLFRGSPAPFCSTWF